MKSHHTLRFFNGIVLLYIISGCTPNLPKVNMGYSDREVISPVVQKTNQIDLDVYLDATTSMQGFAVNNTSVYSQFLDQLEASALSAWQNADTKFYKFGETIRPVDRTAFLSAKNDLSFYHEKGIFLKTYIDSVVKRTDSKRLSVLITDLFQDEGDVNTMVEKFKEKCFANGVAVGIIGVKSEFKGKVFDVRGIPGGYELDAKERPFYAIVFGNQFNMSQLFDALKTKSFVQEDKFLVFSNYIIKSFQVDELVKTRDSKALVNKAHENKSFDFLLHDGNEGKFDLSLTIDKNAHSADFVAKNLELVAFKKSATDPKMVPADSVSTNDFSIENIQRNGNKLRATLVLKNDGEKGNYAYVLSLKANNITGLQLPAWIGEFSTDNPVPGTNSAAKTYNFEKLCSTLLVANAAVSPTYIAKFYINIYKR